MANTKLLILCYLLTCFTAAAEAKAPAASKLGGHRTIAEPPASMRVERSIRDGMAPTTDEQHSVEMVHRGHHRSTLDKSVAGGGVIIGGLATTFLVAVFCYIRATRRHKAGKENESPTVV